MAHFANIDANNVVQRVIVVPNSEEANGAAWCNNLLGGTWLQTSYTGTIRKNFAGVGYTYDQTLDAFIAPKPYQSWVLNQTTCRWEPPIPAPLGGPWEWDEDIEEWVAV
jgi:hypothetical protein